jgi:hypothetical protein
MQSWYWQISRSSDVVLPGDWVVSSVLFFYLLVKLKLGGEVAFPDHSRWSEILISSADSFVTLQLQLLGQLLPQWGVVVHVWMLPSGSGDQLCSPLVALLGGGFLLCFFTGISNWGLISLPPSFSGAGSVFHQPPLLSVCYDSSLFVFQFCMAVRLWVLLSDSGDELWDLLPSLFQGVAYHLPALGLPSFPVFVCW